MADLDVVLINVSKTFEGGVHAVIDFNAEIEHGEFVAMLGPSGCGKTTTLRMIGGLEEVTEGKIYIAGTDVTDLPPSERDTAMMFQSFALFPHRNVHQNVEFSLKVKGIERRGARSAGGPDARDGEPGPARRPLPPGPERRPAAARRAGPGPHQQAHLSCSSTSRSERSTTACASR